MERKKWNNKKSKGHERARKDMIAKERTGKGRKERQERSGKNKKENEGKMA